MKSLFIALLLLLLTGSAQATDRYVAKCTNGIATYSPGGVGTCTGGSNLVYSSLTNAMAVASAGDNIYIRAGSWPGISSGATQPSGKGPAGITGGGAAGVISDFAAATLITVSAYCPDGVCESVTLTIGVGSVVIGVGTTSYVSYENLIIDAAGAEQPVSIYGDGVTPSSVHHIRFLNNEIKNGSQNCIQVQGTPSHHNWIKGNNIHGCGSGNIADPYRFHGIYNGESDSLYEQNTIHDIVGVANLTRGYCAQNYPTATRNTWRSNTFYNCEGMANGGNGNIIYNNVVRNSGNGIANSLGSGNIIYNNTIVNNTGSGIDAQGSSGAVIRNNIVANNPNNIYHTGSGATVSNNLCSTTGGGTTNCSHTVANVSAINFTNYAGNDFTLQGTSPAINAGTAIITGSISIPSCGAAPYCYNSTEPDMGAFESGVPITPPVSQLVLALPLEEGSGSIAVDVSAQKNNATLVGGATWDNDGRHGKAIALDGTGYLNIAPSASFALAAGMTLESWIYPTGPLSDFIAIMAQGDYRYYLYAASGTGSCVAPALAPLGGYDATTVSNIICATSAPPLNQWSHLAVTYDGATMTFFLNGNIVASRSSGNPMVSSSAGLTVGASIFGEYFVGKIDQPMIYNYARTLPQIQSDMNTSLITPPGKYVEIAAPASVEISSASSIEIGAD